MPLEPSRVLALQGFWEVAAFVINVWLFLLVGIQLSGDMLVREAWPILLAVVALHAGRAVAVYVCFGALHLSGQGVPWRWLHVMVFGNVKGALSMAAVLALPQGIAYRDRLIAIVFGVTLVTLLTQAGLLIVWAFGAWRVYGRHIDVGVLTAFLTYIGRFYIRLESMSRMVQAT